MNEQRPDPEALLRAAVREGRGRLKVFLGAAPGVGKTFEMLSEGAARRAAGTDVVIGIVETHGRPETEARAAGIETVPRKAVAWKGHRLEEMDIDAILARGPQLVLVDELAHTNAPGSRHDKRWQDVDELLAAGIDVFSTLNVQHIESLNDVVASFTRVRVRETLPDRILEEADIEIVDIPPDELIERLKEGKVYIPEEAGRALGHFFSKSNLSALRELALRRAAQAVDAQMLDHLRAHAVGGVWATADRLVVAVSEQSGAPELVRAAKRIADALRAPWTAVHIETARNERFADIDNTRLAGTLQLAAQLGAQVATLPAVSVTEGLMRFLGEARATQLIVGKSVRSRWFELRKGSVVDRLVRETPGVAVHVLPLAAEPPSPAMRRGRGPSRGGSAEAGAAGYLWSLLLAALVTLIGAAIFSVGAITNLGLLYLLPVTFAATRYGLRTGLVTGLACSLAYNFFFMPPLHTFTIENPENILTVLVLLGVAVVSSQMASRVRAQAVLASRSASQNSALAGFAGLLTAVRTRQETAQLVCAEIGRLLGVNTVMLMPHEEALVVESASPTTVHLETLDEAAARWAFDANRPAGRGSDTLTASEWLFHPVTAGGRPRGVFGIANADAGAPIRSDRLPMLLSLLDQAGMALERIALEDEMAGVVQLRERDRLRQALLSSVSHDLRTPLTSILGALGAMSATTPEQEAELSSMRIEAERLNRFVANLLDMARIEAGALRQSVEPVDLADAVAAALHDVRKTLAGNPVRLDLPPDLPFVRVDPQLFHHCLINLLDNAVKHGGTGQPIVIDAREDGDGLVLRIRDAGPGLPDGAGTRIFETFARFEGSDRKGGTGLGLAIVKGFAEAMGLSVVASNRSDRPGAEFALRFGPAQVLRESDMA
ncbi:MAG: sensor histidine kinase KdpD [Sphingomonadales bacterium]|nr:sensor histidine kinase KdpD [Sphingomonadales bacterium]